MDLRTKQHHRILLEQRLHCLHDVLAGPVLIAAEGVLPALRCLELVLDQHELLLDVHWWCGRGRWI